MWEHLDLHQSQWLMVSFEAPRGKKISIWALMRRRRRAVWSQWLTHLCCSCVTAVTAPHCSLRLEGEQRRGRELGRDSVTHRGSGEASRSGRSGLTPVTLRNRSKRTRNSLVQPDRTKEKKKITRRNFLRANEKRRRRQFLICTIVCNTKEFWFCFSWVELSAAVCIKTELSHGRCAPSTLLQTIFQSESRGKRGWWKKASYEK